LAEAYGDGLFARRCHQQAHELQTNIEANGWDGQWYLRAYFDNGEKLGSHTQRECQIDTLPQSWSVISGAASLGRSREAMRSVESRLIRRKAGLIQLFDPPFQGHDLNPGYIQGYMPGVRENGGQYTHGAIWTVMAFAMMGESEKAWELFKMLNPIQHTSSPEQIAVYKVEPYVVAADVYAVAPHMGRGGWTWYTGSASWMYRLLLENLLGIERRGDTLILKPLLPLDWDFFKLHYRFKQTLYHIHVRRKAAGQKLDTLLVVDGLALEGNSFLLSDDSREHEVTFTLD
jgi:cellobiose phosphorylase